MKRWIAAAAALCMLFAGCGVIKDTGEYGAYIPTSKIDTSSLGEKGRVEKTAVYFINASSGMLTAEISNIFIGEDTNPATDAIEQLLKGPFSERLTAVAPAGMRLERIECSRNVANVYLKYSGLAILPEDKFKLELAIANTVTDILGTKYTSVFYNGVQPGFVAEEGAAAVPCEPHEKQTGGITDAWLQASANYKEVPALPIPGGEPKPEPGGKDAQQTPESPKENELATVLYFISSGGSFILPEVRDVKYTGSAYVRTLLGELGKGPQNTSVMATPVAEGLELVEEPEILPADDGYILKLNFSKLPTRYVYSDTKDAKLSYAALVYTLTGFLPGVRYVDIYVNGNRVEPYSGASSAGMNRQDFIGLIGSSAPLYFEDKNSDLLLEVSRSMEQAKIWNAKERLLELLKGPLEGEDDNAEPIMLQGITEEDILSVDIYGDTAFVNLSLGFKNACADLKPKSEMLLVYSIVNTITSMDGISKVQFLIEGNQTDTLAGNLCLSNPFIRNYGIIKQPS